jgi:hypothetical protein
MHLRSRRAFLSTDLQNSLSPGKAPERPSDVEKWRTTVVVTFVRNCVLNSVQTPFYKLRLAGNEFSRTMQFGVSDASFEFNPAKTSSRTFEEKLRKI